MYCGESLGIRIPSGKTPTVKKKKEPEKTKTQAFPDTVEMNVMDISHNEPLDAPVHEKINDGDYIENQAEMSIERAMNLLKGFKESYNKDQLKPEEYDKLVLEVIKDYIMPMTDKEKINFVANGIKDSALYEFLNGDIHQNLRTCVIEYVASK